MQVRGTVISVEFDVAVAKNGGGSYQGARFSYRDEAGALKEKGMHNNVFKFNSVLKTQLANLVPGQGFVMEMEKENDFWNIKSVASEAPPTSSQPVATGAKPTPYTAPKSTYETPEERAKKQIYIVRQSTIGHAIEFLNHNNKNYTLGDILKTAKEFEASVFGADFDDGMPLSMKDDSKDVI